jgi:hypothetical protein
VHDLPSADLAVQNHFVQDDMERRRLVAGEDRLALHPCQLRLGELGQLSVPAERFRELC